MSNNETKIGVKRVELLQSVLIVGGGIAGMHAAEEIRRCGYTTVLIEKSDTIGGQGLFTERYAVDCEKLLSGVEVITPAALTRLEGAIGSFHASIRTPEGGASVKCGAVVICSGAGKDCDADIGDGERIVPIADLAQAFAGYPIKIRRRPICLILDMKIEESAASSEMALDIALRFRKRYGGEVYLFCREVRVNAVHLEKLYDEARNAGVAIITYEGEIVIHKTENEVLITARDALLDRDIEVSCHSAGISTYGLGACIDEQLADIAGISTDSQHQMQDNNAHLFPGLTNRPGVFVVGACRGQHYIPKIITDAKATALAVHALLSQKYIEVELNNAVVNEDTCALCLTCIRTCPHKAMTINREKTAAVSIPEACQKCGICVGECPAGAITLPAYIGHTLQKQVP